jgi:hypothetical protein
MLLGSRGGAVPDIGVGHQSPFFGMPATLADAAYRTATRR